MNIKIKKVYDDAVIPMKGSSDAAGYDVYAHSYVDVDALHDIDEMIICPHETKKIGTGISMEIPQGVVGLLFARSGIATKQGLRPANCVGVIDPDFRGEIAVALHNDTDNTQVISTGSRIAQMVFVPYIDVCFTEANNLSDTVRGDGGFGHTGII